MEEDGVDAMEAGHSVEPSGPPLLFLVSSFFAVALLGFLIVRFIVQPVIQSRQRSDEEERRKRMQAQRDRRLQKLEMEAGLFKQSEEFKAQEAKKHEREVGIQPSDRHTVNRQDILGTPPSSIDSHIPSYRPNVRSRYTPKMGG